jgi:hypothetical protein
MADTEAWKNAGAGLIVIKKTNQKGDFGEEAVLGGKVIQISPKDRRANSEMAATEELDVFKNGMLTPIRLIDSEEDAVEIASNPNLMTEQDMKDLFKSHWKTFETRIGEIANETTLTRLLEIGRIEDAKVRQVEAIEARLADVRPVSHIEVVQQSGAAGPMTSIKPVTPK